jgi:Ser/Thr protein kinase RdoA (MazF antagonist)
VNGLGSVIAAQVSAWGGVDLPLERSLFGTVDPDAIAAAVDGWCRVHLGAGIARYRFFDASSGSVHGVELADGRAVVVKGHRAQVAAPYLRAVLAVQADLASAGYPAPRPLTGPEACGAGHLVAEELRARSRPADPYAPTVIRSLASELARFVRLAAGHRDRLAAVSHPMDSRPGDLYPAPHSARFDFVATAAGAEWIDEFARAAVERRRADAPPRVVVHCDWRVQNVSIRGDEIVAVYDWDSVTVADEMAALAVAATTFGADWSAPSTRFPHPSEIAAFVAGYEQARGRTLTPAECDRLATAMVATLSYAARCEHADPAGSGTDQRARLAALGPALLAAGLDELRRGPTG